MEKLKMESKDILNENIEKVAEHFPNVLVEAEDGKKIDFDLLRQELSKDIVEGPRERYHLDFPGKREAIVESNRKTNKTLRPIKEKSVNFDTTKNIYIEGDNLEALKILQESYLGKIKCIYIDPPYNTGNDFVYNDDFSHTEKEELQKEGRLDKNGNVMTSKDINNESSGRYHSDWLKMMYPRLKLARNLLNDKGIIFISIDDNEVDNLRKLCDEIFGINNFISLFIWEKAVGPKNLAKYVSVNHDYVLCYCRSIEDCVIVGDNKTEAALKDYKNKDNDPRGLWSRTSMLSPKYTPSRDFVMTFANGKTYSLQKGTSWRFSKEKMLELEADNRISFEPNMPRKKTFLSETDLTPPKTLLMHDLVGTNQTGSEEMAKIFENKSIFDYPKPVSLLKYLISKSTNESPIILDFFSGSATTAHAVMKLNAEDGGNRQFIMVQLPEAMDEDKEAYKAGYKNICEIGEERIRRAGKKILEENKEAKDLDIGFRVYKIDDSNMKDIYYKPDEVDQQSVLDLISNVKEDRTALDLLTQVMLNLGLTLDLAIEEKTIDKNKFYFVEENALVACFDDKIDLDSLTKALECKPLKVVCKESSFEKDQDKINFSERIKKYSPDTEKYII